MRRPAACLLVLLLVAATAVQAKPPKILAWAFEALEAEGPRQDDAPALVLLDEVSVYVLANSGKIRYERRIVVRILSDEGRELALHPIFYGQNSSLVQFRAWTIRPDGSVDEFDRKGVLDVSLSDAVGYTDTRSAVLPLKNVGVGSAIVVTYTLDEDRPFLQDEWSFQGRIPVRLSRYRLILPPAWTFDAKMLNHPPVEPLVNKNEFTWELRDLPGLGPEPQAAPVSDVAARLAITYLPRRGWGGAKAFRDWSEVSAWYDGLVQPQATADAAIQRVVAELTDGSERRIDRIRAIGRHVQDLRYVSISLGLSAYRPHASPDVLRKRYADCKDKATLMLAMLREAGIRSHPVLVDSRDQGKVFPSFPSPLQFNHCILAIELGEEAVGVPVVVHPRLGRLLLFDPTDDLTPLGDLPWTDQGTKALLVHPESGGLLDLPDLPAEASRADREWTVELQRSGGATIRLVATYTGQYARLVRGGLRGLDDASRLNRWSAALGRRVPGAEVTDATFQNLSSQEGPVRMEGTIQVARFGRAAGPLLLVQPLRILETLLPNLTGEQRQRPVLFPFRFVEHDQVRLKLPDGYTVSEPLEEIAQEATLGRLEIRVTPAGDGWSVDRTLEIAAREIAPADYPLARAFLDGAARAARSRLVLEREGS